LISSVILSEKSATFRDHARALRRRGRRKEAVSMCKTIGPILAVAVAALLVSGLATPATAASDHPKKKTHASKPVPKPASKPKVPEPALGPRPAGM
jgi:hypothetical protein